MCRHDFKYFRILRLWRQVVGYSLAILVLAKIMGVNVGMSDVANAVMPITTNQYWFFTQYFALFFTIPFLNKLMGTLSKKEIVVLLATGLGLLSVMPLFAGQDIFVTKWGYCYLWFIFLYCAGSAIYKLDLVGRVRSLYATLGLVAGIAISAIGAVGATYLPKLIGGGARVGDLAYSYTSPSLVLEAVALFVLFAKIEVKAPIWQKVITCLAPGTFIVYVVHTNVIFRDMVGWPSAFLPLSERSALSAIMGTSIIAFLIFATISMIDVFRRLTLTWIMGVRLKLWK